MFGWRMSENEGTIAGSGSDSGSDKGSSRYLGSSTMRNK